MCLAIPARIVEYVDERRQFAIVDAAGVTRRVNTTMLTGEQSAEVGDHVLLHLGFATSRISAEEAAETARFMRALDGGSECSDDVIEELLLKAEAGNSPGGSAA